MKEINPVLLKHFDNNTLEYDLGKYNFPALILEFLQSQYPSIKSLDTIHEVVEPADLWKITTAVQNHFNSNFWGNLFDDFIEEYIEPLLGSDEWLVKRYPTLNLNVPNQVKLGRLLNFHKGTSVGNGRGMGTIWIPFTKTFETNSMYVLEHQKSNELWEGCITEKWDQTKFESECLKHGWPVTLNPGKAHLFHQDIIHGNVNNDTGKTRLAIDWHVLLKGTEYNSRLPGGFFRKKGDYSQKFTKKDYKVLYAGQNTSYDKYFWLNYQTPHLLDFCEKHEITYNFRSVENEKLVHAPVLEDLIRLKNDIVMLSIHSLPEEEERREYLLRFALKNKITILFANEYIEMSDEESLQKVLYYCNFGVRGDL